MAITTIEGAQKEARRLVLEGIGAEYDRKITPKEAQGLKASYRERVAKMGTSEARRVFKDYVRQYMGNFTYNRMQNAFARSWSAHVTYIHTNCGYYSQPVWGERGTNGDPVEMATDLLMKMKGAEIDGELSYDEACSAKADYEKGLAGLSDYKRQTYADYVRTYAGTENYSRTMGAPTRRVSGEVRDGFDCL